MDLAGVQAAVGQCYMRMLSWSQNGDIIKAVPKKRMSNLAFNVVNRVFRELGGKYVSHQRQAYFELVLEEFGSKHVDDSREGNGRETQSPAVFGPVFRQIEAQLIRLVAAGQTLAKEAP